LLGQPKPAQADPDGAWYTFERGVHKTGGHLTDCLWSLANFTHSLTIDGSSSMTS
jgi:hypothetical protein